MHTIKPFFLICIIGVLLLSTGYAYSAVNTVKSPDGTIVVSFELDGDGTPVYWVDYEGKAAVGRSAMGLVRSDVDCSKGLAVGKVSEVKVVHDSYTMMTGKRSQCEYTANRREWVLTKNGKKALTIIFQVSDDGVAFRYAIPGELDETISINDEKTAFAFGDGTVSWLHPMAVAKTGWSRTQPSYEENYSVAQMVGMDSTFGQGWCFPALFKTVDGIWVLICDSDVDEQYCATHLSHQSKGGVYTIAFPQKDEHRGEIDPIAPQVKGQFESPWRVLMIGKTLGTMVESTLMTDVAEACQLKDASFVEPGRAAWHWLRYGDASSTLEFCNSFLDFAAKMKWEYMLIDDDWDQHIGYEKMAEFVKKANAKGVDVILWYNSNGPWNDAPMTPKNRMHERGVRRDEFAKLKAMGVRGVKVDFFGGDKQATMQLYRDLFRDAADFGIMVNCHGATIPRGWQRTFPNLMTMESVKGMEYCTFDQRNADLEPQHCCILPFTRNAIGSMDYTPTVFDKRIRGVELKTMVGFELALSVVFESGVQHFGLVPDELKLMPDYVVEFLQKVPTAWDETRFVAGEPGRYVIIARRKGSTWYVGGINGENSTRKLEMDLSFMRSSGNVTIISDGGDREFKKQVVPANVDSIELKPHGGFVMVINL